MIPLLNKVQLDQYINRILKYGFDGLEGASKSEMKQVINYLGDELSKSESLALDRYNKNMMIIGKDSIGNKNVKLRACVGASKKAFDKNLTNLKRIRFYSNLFYE